MKRTAGGSKQERTDGPVSLECVLGRRLAPFTIEKPQPHRPFMLFLVDAGEGRMLAVEAIEGGEADAVAVWAAARIEPGARVRVDDDDIAKALRARVAPGIRVILGPTPEVDAAYASFEEYSEKTPIGKGRRHSWKDSASPEAKRAFYSAATEFVAKEPWLVVADPAVMVVDVPGLGWRGGVASVLGNGGETFGLVLYESMEAYTSFASKSLAELEARGPGVPMLSVHLDKPREIEGGRKLRDEARAYGFVPGPQGMVPYILKTTTDMAVLTPTTDDYRLATACLVGVTRFVEKHTEIFLDGGHKKVTLHVSVPVGEGDVEVAVSAPPKVSWIWGEETPREGIVRRQLEQIVEDYEEARLRETTSDEAEADAMAAFEMLEYKQAVGGSLVDWTREDVREFLLDYYPECGDLFDDELLALPGQFATFLGWLGTSGCGPALRLESARACVGACREEFLAAARDVSRYEPGKRMAADLMAAGVDPDDQEAVERFMEGYVMPLDEPRKLRSAPNRWVWDGQGPAPDPKGPCPCGSDQRYRKCCMPR